MKNIKIKLIKHTIAISNIILLFIIFGSFNSLAQVITGELRDYNSGSPIPYTNITIIGGGSTISNENGEFVLTNISLPVKIIISNVAYIKDTILVDTEKPKTIMLRPMINILKEVIITNYGYKLLNSALSKIESNDKALTADVFYRETIKANDKIYEFHEIFYSVKLNCSQLLGTRMINSRFAKIPYTIENQYLGIGNFTYIVLAQSLLKKPYILNHERILFPFCSNFADYYNINVNEISSDSIAVLKCTPTIPQSYHSFDGYVYINIKDNLIEKVEGNLRGSMGIDTDNEFIKTDNFNSSIIISNSSYLGMNYINHISVNMTYDRFLKKENKKEKEIVQGNVFISNYQKLNHKIKYKNIEIQQDDITEMKKVKYKPNFWDSNPVFKRTISEDSSILSFQKAGLITNIIEK